MATDDDDTNPTPPSPDGPASLVDDLGVTDLRSLIFGKHGRLFSAAGRNAPVCELSEDYLVLHPAQKPFEAEGPAEEVAVHIDNRGILLDELGSPKQISGAKYEGCRIFMLGDRLEGTFKHFVAYEKDGQLHRLLIENEPVTHEALYKMRNQTHDGELSKFKDLTSE